jgi:hypothetical protein
MRARAQVELVWGLSPLALCEDNMTGRNQEGQGPRLLPQSFGRPGRKTVLEPVLIWAGTVYSDCIAEEVGRTPPHRRQGPQPKRLQPQTVAAPWKPGAQVWSQASCLVQGRAPPCFLWLPRPQVLLLGPQGSD